MPNAILKQAAVIGAGIGGLAAAKAVAPHFEKVIVFDRDALPDEPAPRSGTPQARHTHNLLAGGCRALESLFPGIELNLVEAGAVRMRSADGIAQVSGGARAADVAAATDPLGLAPVTGSVAAVGMAGLTLGGGYGPLIGRFGLALDNLEAAEVVLADGCAVVAKRDSEEELFWTLRGGGNFGIVTTMRLKLHRLPSVRSGMLIYPFAEAKAVLEGCAEIARSAPEELTSQVGLAGGPDGAPMVMVVPTWCGPPEEGEARLAPFFQLGTVLMSTVETTPYGVSLTVFDKFLVYGQRYLIETCSLPAFDSRSVDAFIGAMETAVSPGCAVFTHEFKVAAARVPEEATAFGLRRDHVLVEIIAWFADGPDNAEEERHRRWARATREVFDATALPGGYPNLLAGDEDADRVARSYGRNAGRLIRAKQRYDPDNVFRSAIPLPVASAMAGAS